MLERLIQLKKEKERKRKRKREKQRIEEGRNNHFRTGQQEHRTVVPKRREINEESSKIAPDCCIDRHSSP